MSLLSTLHVMILCFVCGIHSIVDPYNVQRHVYTVEDFCEKLPRTVSFHEQLIIRSQTQGQIAYKTNVHCAMGVNATKDISGLIVAMRTVSTQSCADNLTIMAVGYEKSTLCGNLYSEDSARNVYVIQRSPVEIIWQTHSDPIGSVIGLGFEMTITPFFSKCDDNTTCFKCASGRYIHRHFVCNGRNNCGDLSDEYNCQQRKALSIVGIITGVLSICTFSCLISFLILRHMLPRCKGEQDRQLREPYLDDGERTPLFRSSSVSTNSGIAYNNPHCISFISVRDGPDGAEVGEIIPKSTTLGTPDDPCLPVDPTASCRTQGNHSGASD